MQDFNCITTSFNLILKTTKNIGSIVQHKKIGNEIHGDSIVGDSKVTN